jgi:hypothetical protein
MTTTTAFPSAEPTDPEDVAWTLQTAGTMWARGDSHEAVRWLRRAAEAAGDAGDDLRAVVLARAAADLSVELELPPSIPPPSVAPDQTHRMAPFERAPITPMDDAETAHDHTIPDGPAMEAPHSSPARRPPPPPSSRSTPSASPAPLRSSPSVAPSSASSPSAAQRSSPMAARSSPSTAPGAMAYRQRQALRVAVVPSPDEKNLLLVRPLADDEPLPEGAHEALLTALEPGAHLLSKKR